MTDHTVGTGSLIAPRIDSTQWYSGASVAVEIHDLAESIRNKDWVEGGIDTLALTAEAAGVIVDPIGALASWGVGWAMEHVQWMSDLLDWLAGDPDQVAAYGQTWENIAGVAETVTERFQDDVNGDLSSWNDGARMMYTRLAQERLDTLDGLGKAAHGMAGLAEAVGTVVNAVRSGVRAAISFLVGKLISWGIELAGTLGAAAPVVLEQAMVAIGQTGVKIVKIVSSLLSSLRKLHDALKKYKLLITALKVGLGTQANEYSYKPYGD